MGEGTLARQILKFGWAKVLGRNDRPRLVDLGRRKREARSEKERSGEKGRG